MKAEIVLTAFCISLLAWAIWLGVGEYRLWRHYKSLEGMVLVVDGQRRTITKANRHGTLTVDAPFESDSNSRYIVRAADDD